MPHELLAVGGIVVVEIDDTWPDGRIDESSTEAVQSSTTVVVRARSSIETRLISTPPL